MDKLDLARQEMGLVDTAIIASVVERMHIARRMGEIKKTKGLPVLPEGFTLNKALDARKERAKGLGAQDGDAAIVGKVFAVLVQAAIDVEKEAVK